MTEALEQLLRLVADGKLSAEDAAPLLAALDDEATRPGTGSRASSGRPDVAAGNDAADARATGPGGSAARPVARHVHIEVREHGRSAVDLRLPLALGHAAVRMVPGLTNDHAQRIRDALSAGVVGPILDVVDEDGDGVRITLD
jgi:SHOCT-like domain